jgi:hypothetical protein
MPTLKERQEIMNNLLILEERREKERQEEMKAEIMLQERQKKERQEKVKANTRRNTIKTYRGIARGASQRIGGALTRVIPSLSMQYKYYKSKGRPKGTYSGQYKAYGGVYGYRKAMSIRNQMLRAQIERQRMLSPEEQNLIAELNRKKMMSAQNPERRAIPDTSGNVSMSNFHKEILDATRLVD